MTKNWTLVVQEQKSKPCSWRPITVLAGFNELGFNKSSRFNELVLDQKIFFGFINTSNLTNIRVIR